MEDLLREIKTEVKSGLSLIDNCVNNLAQAKFILENVLEKSCQIFEMKLKNDKVNGNNGMKKKKVSSGSSSSSSSSSTSTSSSNQIGKKFLLPSPRVNIRPAKPCIKRKLEVPEQKVPPKYRKLIKPFSIKLEDCMKKPKPTEKDLNKSRLQKRPGPLCKTLSLYPTHHLAQVKAKLVKNFAQFQKTREDTEISEPTSSTSESEIISLKKKLRENFAKFQKQTEIEKFFEDVKNGDVFEGDFFEVGLRLNVKLAEISGGDDSDSDSDSDSNSLLILPGEKFSAQNIGQFFVLNSEPPKLLRYEGQKNHCNGFTPINLEKLDLEVIQSLRK